MKNLDLNGLGVQEMNAEEMNGVDGGFLPQVLKFIATGLAWELLTEGPEKCWEDFKSGFNSVK